MTDVATTLRSAYLAGPMRGYDEYNFPAFRKQAAWLRGLNWTVISPAEMDEEDPLLSDPDDLAYFMARDLKAVCEADCVILLSGWEDSTGARLEAVTAAEIGHPVFAIEYDDPHGTRVLRSVDPEHVRMVFANRGAPEEEETVEGHKIHMAIHAPFACQCAGRDIDGCDGYTPDPTSPRHPNSARFHELLGEAGEMHDRKQLDYGKGDDPFANVRASEDWGIRGWVGAMVRLNDKVKRLQSLSTKGHLVNEAAKDSFMDIAVYALIAYVLYEQGEAS